MRYEYLIFNLLIIAGPLLAGKMYSKTKYPDGKRAVLAILATAGIFWIWDHLVTGWWWEFNPQFIWGWKIGRLPIEEMIFFLTVPYACLLIWENIKQRWGMGPVINSRWRLTGTIFFLISSLLAVGNSQPYTAMVMAGAVLVLVVDAVSKINLFQKANFFVFLGVVGIMTAFWNGYLTARPVVEYNREVKTNLNLGTVPMEDFIYGWVMVALVVLGYEKAGLKQGKGK